MKPIHAVVIAGALLGTMVVVNGTIVAQDFYIMRSLNELDRSVTRLAENVDKLRIALGVPKR